MGGLNYCNKAVHCISGLNFVLYGCIDEYKKLFVSNKYIFGQNF